jgi:hypothetical protein
MPSPFDDVIVYKGRFYAVDNTGRTVVVAMDTNLGLVGNPVFGGDKKYLVESKGDLLLVDMYLSIDSDEGLSIGHDVVQDLVQYMSERTVWFKVFKLNEEGKCWIEVNDLEDRVLFLGDDLTFSASASELSGCKGNCIFFNDDFFYSRGEGDDGSLFGRDIGVFELESGCIGPLRNFPDNSKMFWPPPDWVASTSLEVSLHFPPSITVYMKFQFYLRMLALSYLDFAIYFHRSLNLFGMQFGYVLNIHVLIVVVALNLAFNWEGAHSCTSIIETF